MEIDIIEDKLDKLLKIEQENNKMLKEIIKYINYTIVKAHEENVDDFGRNVLANMVSTKIFKF